VGVAQLAAQLGEVERALELLTLAERHEASAFETKKRARKILTESADQLLPTKVQTAHAQRQTEDLWVIAQTMLTRLTTEL
jgi:hypothetical protein